jgi:hypothetical protein
VDLAAQVSALAQLARRADSVEFQYVAQFAESIASPDVVGPLLKFGGVDFDDGAAVATREMVMVNFHVTATVEAFATIGHDDVDLAAFDEFLQLGVDSGQRNLLTLASDTSVQVLGAHKSLNAI